METSDNQNRSPVPPAPPSDLIELIKAWGNEVGQPTLRPTFEALKKKITDLSVDLEQLWKDLAPHLTPEISLLLILVLSLQKTAARHLLLRQALLKIVSEPSQRVLGALFFFPPEEIRENLAPLLYSKGIQGRRAVYLMARLKLGLNPEAISGLLAFQGHDRHFLINLSHLVEPGLRPAVREMLLSEPGDKESGNKSPHEEFSEYMLDGPPSDPISPDSSASESRAGQQGNTTSSVSESPAPPEVNSPSPRTISPSTHEVSENPLSDSFERAPRSFSTTESQMRVPPPIRPPENASIHSGSVFGFPKQLFWPIFVGVCIGLLTIGLLASRQEGVEARSNIPLPLQTHAPDYWIDAVSRQRITQAFLKSDSDFQMGEIFVNRGDFSSALKLFQDALAQYPVHTGARFREAYCLMQMQDYKSAAVSFRKVLSLKPDYPQANLFLARIALVNNEPDQAAQHFSKEFALRKELRVGLEYCRLLNQLGKFPESIAILAELERRFPSDMIISSMLTFAREQLKGKPK